MPSSPHLPFLSLLLLLLPALPVQAWFVRLLMLIRASPTKTQIDQFFVSHKQNCVQGSLNSGAGRCLGNGPDFPLKFTCHLVRSFFLSLYTQTEANAYAEKKRLCLKADVGYEYV